MHLTSSRMLFFHKYVLVLPSLVKNERKSMFSHNNFWKCCVRTLGIWIKLSRACWIPFGHADLYPFYTCVLLYSLGFSSSVLYIFLLLLYVLLILINFLLMQQQEEEAFATSTVSKIFFENVVLYTDEFR
jgi:hypothetical protein